MAASLAATTTFGSLAAGNQNLSLFDTQFSSILTGLNTLSNFANYYADGGTSNAYAITVPTTQTVTSPTQAGLPLQFKALNANTGNSTLAVTYGTAVTTATIVTQSGAALPPGTIAANAIVSVIADGTKFSLQSASAVVPGALTASLGSDVTLGSTGIYFDGPSVAQGTTGTWFVVGSVMWVDTAGAAEIYGKLWDGTTIIDSGGANTSGANSPLRVTFCGFITNPVGNLRVSVRDISSASGKILFNRTGNPKDSTITAFRIA